MLMATFLVTGCNRGIGLGLAQKILREGHQLIATTRRLNASRDLWEIEHDYPEKVTFLEFDVTNEEQMAEELKSFLPIRRSMFWWIMRVFW